MSQKKLLNRSIALIALPLSRPSNPADRRLTYYYAQPLLIAHSSHHPSSPPRRSTQISLTTNLIERWTDLGTRHWNKLADSKPGSWKSNLFNAGERMMDKIPYEEWALKAIDRSIVLSSPPTPRSSRRPVEAVDRPIHSIPPPKLELIYPPSISTEQELLDDLRVSMIDRGSYHSRWMKWNLFLSPLTLPFAIVPLIPNLPLFYILSVLPLPLTPLYPTILSSHF